MVLVAADAGAVSASGGLIGSAKTKSRDGGRIGLRRFAREFERALHDRVDLGIDRIELLRVRDREHPGQPLPEGLDGIAPDPCVDLVLLAVGSNHRVAFMMADDAVGLRLDQRRPLPAARPLKRARHRRADGNHVIAVDRNAWNSVGLSAAGDVGVQRRIGERRRSGVEVVLADEDGCGAIDRGKIDRLVKAAVIDRAITEEGYPDIVGALHLLAHPDARGMADAGRDNPVGAEQADRAVVEMHRPTAPAAAAVGLAEEFGHQQVRVHPLGQRMAVTTVGRGDPVARPQQRTGADRDRFLADVEMQEAGRLALTAGNLGRGFEPAQQHHAAVKREQGRRIEAVGKPGALFPPVPGGSVTVDLQCTAPDFPLAIIIT